VHLQLALTERATREQEVDVDSTAVLDDVLCAPNVRRLSRDGNDRRLCGGRLTPANVSGRCD
jgi:hypothetical protein